jgi:ribonuclease HII
MRYIVGIDEVGRGCVAGPVYLTGVSLSSDFPKFIHLIKPFDKKYDELKLVRDSKKLTLKNRQKVFEIAHSLSIISSTLYVDNTVIDRFGIGVCLSHLLLFIVNILGNNSKKIIVDGKIKLISETRPDLIQEILVQNNLTNFELLPFSHFNIIRENKADDTYLSVALASNIAKVQRDEYMANISKEFPEYGWNKNKGYGTEFHRNAIRTNPQNLYFRKTYLTKILQKNISKS